MTDHQRFDARIIAEVMEWPIVDIEAAWAQEMPFAVWNRDRGNYTAFLEDGSGPFSPSTDIAAAWRVLRHFTDQGIAVEVSSLPAYKERGACWRVRIDPPDAVMNTIVLGETEMEAICQAALDVVRRRDLIIQGLGV